MLGWIAVFGPGLGFGVVASLKMGDVLSDSCKKRRWRSMEERTSVAVRWGSTEEEKSERQTGSSI